MVKNRVVPARNTASSSNSTTDLNSDPFFASSSTKTTSKNDRFFGKPKDKYQENKHEIDNKSKHIKKAKNVRGANKFNTKNNDSFPIKFDPQRNKIKHNKSLPKLTNKSVEKYRQTEEDAEYSLQAKNKCRDIVKFEGKVTEKKPFDKKKYRLQKYSKKYKLDQWEEKRKKSVLREFYQQTKEDKSKVDVKKIYEKYDSDQDEQEEEQIQPRKNYVQHPDFKPPTEKIPQSKGKNSTKKKVQLELQRIKEEKEAKKEELLKKKQEKEEAMKLYRQKKNEKQKQLNKKTKRGQPVMKGRIEMLLDKIQNS